MTGKVSRLDRMHSAIQLAGFHYITCLKATPTSADHQLTVEKSTFVFASIERADSRVLHGEFQAWASSSVLRDLLEHFSNFLTETYCAASERDPGGRFSTTPERFERMGLEGQLAILSRDFSIDPAWPERLTAYNRARNCLAHRSGIVGVKDVTNEQELVVRWLTAKFATHDGPVVSPIAAEGPFSHLIRAQHIDGKGATFQVNDRERRFKIGSALRFKPDELLEIYQTIHLAAVAYDGLVK